MQVELLDHKLSVGFHIFEKFSKNSPEVPLLKYAFCPETLF